MRCFASKDYGNIQKFYNKFETSITAIYHEIYFSFSYVISTFLYDLNIPGQMTFKSG